MSRTSSHLGRVLFAVILCGLFQPPESASAQVLSGEAQVSVDARFRDSLLEELTLDLVCGQEKVNRKTRVLTRDEIFVWTTGTPQNGSDACRVTARLPEGYSATYRVDGVTQTGNAPKGCPFSKISAGERRVCEVDVTQDPVRLTVYLEWIGPSGEEDDVRISLECESGEYSGYRYVNEGKPDGWEIRNIDPEGILCNVSELVRDNFRPDIIDCQGLWVLPGKGEECTLTNTKIVKRIEMLNRYGQVVMILLVLGVGLVAVKRFSGV